MYQNRRIVKRKHSDKCNTIRVKLHQVVSYPSESWRNYHDLVEIAHGRNQGSDTSKENRWILIQNKTN